MREWLRLGPLGWRLMAAFLVVGLSSIVGLMVATALELDHGVATVAAAQRQRLADRLAASASAEFERTGGWSDVDLSASQAVAQLRDAHLIAVDAAGEVVVGGPVGPGFRTRAVSAPVVVDGQTVGRVFIAFGSDRELATAHLGAAWFVAAGLIAAAAGLVTAVIVTRLLTKPLVQLAAAAEAFAGQDRSVRAPENAPGELGQLGRAFNSMAGEIQRTEQARRRMSADVAHELRTPLTALQACLEEVRDGLVPADPPTLSALHDQAVRLGRIVNDLSDLAQAESPSFELRPERMDLADLASDTLMVWRPRIEEAGLTLRTSLQMGTMVSIDSDRMGQVMTNLLSNAVRYSSPGDSITVEVRAADDEAILMISDTGPGMSPEDLPRVRTHSYRGADQRAKPGSGIGLAVVGLLVEAHGGEMDIASKVDHGTTVVVRLPRSR